MQINASVGTMVALLIFVHAQLPIIMIRAVTLHLFFADLDPAAFLNADPDPADFFNADPEPS